jgi:hypothetical protein
MSAARVRKDAIPVLVVPYMGEIGRRICGEAGVCWLDLSGNAHLVAPGLRAHVEGKPNKFKRPGRPRSVFAPKSSRIARWLLIHRQRSFTQRELAEATGMDEGFTSRIVRRLEEQEFVTRGERGAVRIRNYDAMLNAWREAYDFSRHTILRGHVAARSGEEILRRLPEQFRRWSLRHAATGLGAAWLWTHFAGFRLVVFYVAESLEEDLRREVGFHEEERGENVWLIVPNDMGVFHGSSRRGGVECVHPVQAYLDLKGHPERSEEAADHLRKELLAGNTNA